jgi:hypothetical protein
MMDPEATGFVTAHGLIHLTCWYDYTEFRSDLVIMCTQRVAPNSTRAHLKEGEVVTCLSCLGMTRTT